MDSWLQEVQEVHMLEVKTANYTLVELNGRLLKTVRRKVLAGTATLVSWNLWCITATDQQQQQHLQTNRKPAAADQQRSKAVYWQQQTMRSSMGSNLSQKSVRG